MKRTVSHSEVESYLRCELAHFYGYGMEIQNKWPGDALKRGTMNHTILEEYHNVYQATEDWQEAFTAAQKIRVHLMTHEPDGASLLTPIVAVQDYYMTGWFPAQGWKILHIEQDFVLDITEDLQTPIIPDLVVQDRFGSIGVLDSKTTYDFYGEEYMALAPQLPKYVGALRAKGITAAWSGYLFFRYRGRKDDSPGDRFKFHKIDLSDTRIQQTFIEQIVASERIQELKKLPLPEWKGKILRVMNEKICQSCSFKKLCITELNEPSQAQYVLNAHYQKRERRDFNGEQSTEVE